MSITEEPGNVVERGSGAPASLVVATPLTPVQAMKITAAVVFVLGLCWLLVQIREIVLLLAIGILLGAAMEPVVNRMRRIGLSRAQSILVIYALIVLLIGVGLSLVVPPLFDQGREFVTQFPDYLDRVQEQARASSNTLINTYAADGIDRALALAESFRENPPLQVGQVTQAVGILTSAAGILISSISVLIVAFYWLTEKSAIKRIAIQTVPLHDRERAHGLWDDIERRLGSWALGQLFLMLIIGSISTVAYGIMGLPFWFLLGVWAGLTELIPIIGPFLGGAVAFLVALSDSWQKAVIVLVFVVVLQQLEGSIIVPRVMNNAVGLSSLAVILAVLIGTTLMGPIGAILAIPVAAAVQVVVSEFLGFRRGKGDSPSGQTADQANLSPGLPSGTV